MSYRSLTIFSLLLCFATAAFGDAVTFKTGQGYIWTFDVPAGWHVLVEDQKAIDEGTSVSVVSNPAATAADFIPQEGDSYITLSFTLTPEVRHLPLIAKIKGRKENVNRASQPGVPITQLHDVIMVDGWPIHLVTGTNGTDVKPLKDEVKTITSSLKKEGTLKGWVMQKGSTR